MSRAVILGSHAAILPFRAVGVELMPAEDADAARARLRLLAADFAEGLVLVTEDLAESCRDEIAELRRHPGVAVLPLASPAAGAKSAGAQREWIRQLVRRAIGVDLMGRKL